MKRKLSSVGITNLPLSAMVKELLGVSAEQLDAVCAGDPSIRCRICAEAYKQVWRAYPGGKSDPKARLDVQVTLALILRLSMTKPPAGVPSPEGALLLCEVQSIIERALLVHLDRFVDQYLLRYMGVAHVADLPRDSVAFQQALRRMIKASPAFDHSFFEFLAERATFEDIGFYLSAESLFDFGFADLVALAQIGAKGTPKLVEGENYWDEVGNGNLERVHDNLFQQAMIEARVEPISDLTMMPMEVLESGNLATALVLQRRYWPLAIGHLAATEFLVPHRFQKFMDGWLRNGLSEKGAAYQREHIGVDGIHSRRWFEEVIGPEIESDPLAAEGITRGVVYRLVNSEMYLDALSRWLDPQDSGKEGGHRE